MIAPLGLPQGVTDFAVACQKLVQVRSAVAIDPDDSNDEDEEDNIFQPNSSGFHVTLADGTKTRLRFRKQAEGGNGSINMVAEIRYANRDIKIEEVEGLKEMAHRVIAFFDDHHKSLEWTLEARLTFRGFQAVFDAQCACYRDRGAIGEAARFGASPWLMAMLASAIFVMEIGVADLTHVKMVDGLQKRRVEETHVIRAYDLLQIFHDIRSCWDGKDPSSVLEQEAQAERRDQASRRQAATVASLPINFPHACGLCVRICSFTIAKLCSQTEHL